jgi:site-specific recombinase XerD
MTDQTISQAISAYLGSVAEARKEHTARTYGNALNIFSAVLKERWLDPATTPAEKLTEDAITWLASHLKVYASATERLYITAVAGFYKYLVAERIADINLPRLSLLIQQRARRPGIRFPQFPADDIERLLSHISSCMATPSVFYATALWSIHWRCSWVAACRRIWRLAPNWRKRLAITRSI